MGTTFKGEKRWVREIVQKFLALEEHQIEPLNQDPQVPEWVDNLLFTVVGVSYRGLNFQNMKNWKARELGKMLGRHFAGEHLIRWHVR